MNQIKLALVLPLIAWVVVATENLANAQAKMSQDFSATLYEIGSHQSHRLYDFKHLRAADDTFELSIFMDPSNGHEVAIEELNLSDGKVVRYRQEMKQVNEQNTVEIKGSKLYFTKVEGGKTKTDDEDLPENLIVPPTTTRFIQKNWAQLMKGDSVKARMAIPGRLETVGFKFTREDDEKFRGEEVVVIKMKPTSFIISALVDPMYFRFKKDGSRILEFVGRLLPKQKIKGEWRDLDADMVYQYPDGK